jgi:hypothetical protein
MPACVIRTFIPTQTMMRTMHFPAVTLVAASLIGFVLASRGADAPADSAERARQALAVLQSDAPPGEKAVACKRLAVYGGSEAVSALAPLLANENLASWARIPLETIPGPEADEALREALSRLQGNLLVGSANRFSYQVGLDIAQPLT